MNLGFQRNAKKVLAWGGSFALIYAAAYSHQSDAIKEMMKRGPAKDTAAATEQCIEPNSSIRDVYKTKFNATGPFGGDYSILQEQRGNIVTSTATLNSANTVLGKMGDLVRPGKVRAVEVLYITSTPG